MSVFFPAGGRSLQPATDTNMFIFLVHDYIHAATLLYSNIVQEITRAEVISDDYTTPVRNEQKISNFWHPSDHRPILVEIEL